MGKEHEFLAAVRSQNILGITRLFQKLGKNKSLLNSGKQKKFNINCQDIEGMTGVHHAAYNGNLQILHYLLENGAHADLPDNKGLRAVHYACAQGRLDCLQLLVHFGCGVNSPTLDGSVPMHFACRNGQMEVANFLICCQADILSRNQQGRSPLDVASEYGHYGLVELLLSTGQVQHELIPNRPSHPGLFVEHNTCVHLATKRGHVEVLKLLLCQPGVNINRLTPQGTCLHVAAMYGHHHIVKFLIEMGIDVRLVNSFQQSAADVVNKSMKGSKELKQLLKESIASLPARAIKDYCDLRNPSSVTFREGDIITVLDQCSDGMWKGYVTSQGISRTGYFPASCVTIVDRVQSSLTPHSNQHTNAAAALSLSCATPTGTPQHRAANPPVEMMRFHSTPTRAPQSNNATPVHVKMPTSPQGVMPLPCPEWSSASSTTKCPTNTTSLSCDVTSDSGTGPPSMSGTSGYGGSQTSNRNSSASVDSGRSSAHTIGSECGRLPVVSANPQHRSSLQSMESGVIGCRQSCASSSSSSSLGSSLEHLEGGGGGHVGDSTRDQLINVADLKANKGMSDADIIQLLLSELQLNCYAERLLQAGYDLFTMSRMTPEDLNAAGVTNPKHRKRLKSEMSRLQLIDGLPNYIPESVSKWLKSLNLMEYQDILTKQGYATMEDISELSWEDLEDIGIKKLGHQKKFMLAVERLKRLKRGHLQQQSLLEVGSGSAVMSLSCPASQGAADDLSACHNQSLPPCCVQRWPYPCSNHNHSSNPHPPPGTPVKMSAPVSSQHHVLIHSHSGVAPQDKQQDLPGGAFDKQQNVNNKPELRHLSQLRGSEHSSSPSRQPNFPPQSSPVPHSPRFVHSMVQASSTRPSAIVAPNNACSTISQSMNHQPSTPQPVRATAAYPSPTISSNSLERSASKKKQPPAPPKRIDSIKLNTTPYFSATSTPTKQNRLKEDAAPPCDSSSSQYQITLPESELSAATMSTSTDSALSCRGADRRCLTLPRECAGTARMEDSRQMSSGECSSLQSRSSSQMSVDSNYIPFANENCGTIRQRAHQLQSSLDLALGSTNADDWLMFATLNPADTGSSLKQNRSLLPVHLPYDTSSMRRNPYAANEQHMRMRSQPPDRRPPGLPVSLPKPSLSNAQASAEERVRLPNLDGDDSSTGGDFDNICDMLEDLTELLDREIDKSADNNSASSSSTIYPSQESV